jgi:Tfp pilus assembly protein PilO
MSARTRMILAGVAVGVVLVAFVFLFIRPRQSELGEVRDDVEQEEARTVSLRSELRRLQALQENAPKLEAELARFRELVPARDEVASFIFLVQDAANAAGVDFVQISPELPKPPPEGAPVAEVRATIGAGGGYFSVQDFMRRLYDLDRALRIDNLALTGQENEETGETDLTVTLTSRIFFEPPGGVAGAPATAPGTAPATGTETTPPATQTTSPES